MIFDELIAVLFSFILLLLEGLSAIVVLIINVFAYLIEFIMLLFVSDFSLSRAKRYQRKNKTQIISKHNHQNQEKGFGIEKYIPILLIMAVVFYLGINNFLHRKVTFVSDEGHSLPFASVVIYNGEKAFHKRTKNDGSLSISRFQVDKLVINDKRYKTTSWQSDEIQDILTVKRSLLGKGVDKLATKLLEKLNSD